MKDVEIIGMLKSYIKATLVGMGALKGAPCQIKSLVEEPAGTYTITFSWVDTDDVEHTDSIVLQYLELGETSVTAYRGDRGKTAYDHSQISNGTNPHATTANNVNLNTALTIDGASKTTTEAAISTLASLVDHITNGEYSSIASVLS